MDGDRWPCDTDMLDFNDEAADDHGYEFWSMMVTMLLKTNMATLMTIYRIATMMLDMKATQVRLMLGSCNSCRQVTIDATFTGS